jgi:glycosyl transferase family 9 (putative heptosyltransferase)
MKVLLTRFGGIGDCFPTVAVAKYLAAKGHEVTVGLRDDGDKTKQSALFAEDKDIKVIDIKQVGPWRDRCVDTELGMETIQTTYGNFDRVIDYMNIIENNTTSPHNNMTDSWEHWQRSRNSNFTNWFDIHFAWANVDPTKVAEEWKRPSLILSEEEKDIAAGFKAKYEKLFVIHPFASSLARSWYQAKNLVPKILTEYPGAAILFWNPQESNWDLLTVKGPSKLPKLVENPLRETMVALSVADLVISVDTGCSHMAEGLGVKSIVIYSTVPAWTRNKYYRHQTHIDPGENNPEFYTFSLGLGDPLRVKDGVETMSEREKLVKSLFERRAGLQEAMEELNTDAQGADLELNLYVKKNEALERQQSKALSSVTVDSVFKLIKEKV